MSWMVVVWREKENDENSEYEEVVPDCWVQNNVLYWPKHQTYKLRKERRAPSKFWHRFPVVKVKFTSDSFQECKEYDGTSAEDTCTADIRRHITPNVMSDFDYYGDSAPAKKRKMDSSSEESDNESLHVTKNAPAKSTNKANLDSDSDCASLTDDLPIVPQNMGISGARISTSVSTRENAKPQTETQTSRSSTQVFNCRSESTISQTRSPNSEPTSSPGILTRKNAPPQTETSSRSSTQLSSCGSESATSQMRRSSSSQAILTRKNAPPQTETSSRSSTQLSSCGSESATSQMRRSSSSQAKPASRSEEVGRHLQFTAGTSNSASKTNRYPMEEERFQRKVITYLVELKQMVKALQRDGAIQVERGENDEIITKCDSLEDMEDFLQRLEDKQYRQSLLLAMKRVGGKDARQTIQNLLNRTMSPLVMAQYNIRGSGTKRSFSATRLYKLIRDAVLDNVPMSSESEISSLIGEYIKHAPRKLLRMRERVARAQAEESRGADESD